MPSLLFFAWREVLLWKVREGGDSGREREKKGKSERERERTKRKGELEREWMCERKENWNIHFHNFSIQAFRVVGLNAHRIDIKRIHCISAASKIKAVKTEYHCDQRSLREKRMIELKTTSKKILMFWGILIFLYLAEL